MSSPVHDIPSRPASMLAVSKRTVSIPGAQPFFLATQLGPISIPSYGQQPHLQLPYHTEDQALYNEYVQELALAERVAQDRRLFCPERQCFAQQMALVDYLTHARPLAAAQQQANAPHLTQAERDGYALSVAAMEPKVYALLVVWLQLSSNSVVSESTETPSNPATPPTTPTSPSRSYTQDSDDYEWFKGFEADPQVHEASTGGSRARADMFLWTLLQDAVHTDVKAARVSPNSADRARTLKRLGTFVKRYQARRDAICTPVSASVLA